MTALTTQASLRATLLAALDDAIVYRTADFAFCHHCRQAPDGLCPEHRDDSAAVDDYTAARTIIASSLP